MTHRIDFIPLDNPALGWVFRSLSKRLPRLEFQRPDMPNAGRDGTVEGLPAWVSAPELDLVVMTPRANLAALIMLVSRGKYLDDTNQPGRRVRFELLEVTPTGYGHEDEIVDATFRIRHPSVFWRDSVESTMSVALSAASVTVGGLFPGMSAPIADATIRVRGACTGLQISDSDGSWLTFPDIPAGHWLRIEGARVFLTSTDTWSGGDERSGLLDFGGPRGTFEITPDYTDVTTRAGKLTVTTATRASAQIEVRGRGAHIV